VLVLSEKIRYTLSRHFRAAGRLPRTGKMSTRPPAKTPSLQRAQTRSQRILAGLFFFVVCVLVMDALVGDQGLLATMRARKEFNQLVTDLARLRSENAALREEARRLREDPAAIEEVARRELGLMSPGERLFIIKDLPASGSKK
jgi:cell division protein FtsB